MTREEFKTRLSALIEQEQGEYVLYLRAAKLNEDNAIFCITELDEAYDFINGSEEWYVDIYENVPDELGGSAFFTGEALVSWELD